MKKTIDHLIDFDIYSKRTSFFFQKKEKIGSYFGLFLTIVYIIASLSLLVYQIVLAFQRKEFKVYDTTIHSKDMPSIMVDANQLYFAFGLEDPLTSNRFIDNSIYIPKIVFIDILILF